MMKNFSSLDSILSGLKDLKRIILYEQEEIPLRRRVVEPEIEEEEEENLFDLYKKLDKFLNAFSEFLDVYEEAFRQLDKEVDNLIKSAGKKAEEIEDIKILRKYRKIISDQFEYLLRYYNLGEYFLEDLKDIIFVRRKDIEILDIFDNNLDFTDYFLSGLELISDTILDASFLIEKLEDKPEYRTIVELDQDFLSYTGTETEWYKGLVAMFKPFKEVFDRLYEIYFDKWKEKKKEKNKKGV